MQGQGGLANARRSPSLARDLPLLAKHEYGTSGSQSTAISLPSDVGKLLTPLVVISPRIGVSCNVEVQPPGASYDVWLVQIWIELRASCTPSSVLGADAAPPHRRSNRIDFTIGKWVRDWWDW